MRANIIFFLSFFPHKVLTSFAAGLCFSFPHFLNKVFAALTVFVYLKQEDIFCEGSSSAPGMIIKTADI